MASGPGEVIAPPSNPPHYEEFKLAEGLHEPYRLPDEYVAGLHPLPSTTIDCPVVAFINARSGGRMGAELAAVLRRAIGSAQVGGCSWRDHH